MMHADENACTLPTFLGQYASSVPVPFNLFGEVDYETKGCL